MRDPYTKYNEDGLPVMQGNASMATGASYFEVPLYSHVVGELYQGCSPAEFTDGPQLVRDAGFDRILNLFVWGNYPIGEGVLRMDVEMYDGGEVYDELENLADIVENWYIDGHKILVHCQAGLNRSSLVVARFLMNHFDQTAREAIARVREQRSSMCLCNDHFRLHLLALEERDERRIA